MDFKMDGRDDGGVDKVSRQRGPVVGEVTEKQAAILAQQTIDELERMRVDLARAYTAFRVGQSWSTRLARC